MRARVAPILACALLFLSCRHADTPEDGGLDMAPDFAGFRSDCGHPGDKGNSLGVGMFCLHVSDCRDNIGANVCTTLGDPDNYFCTMGCAKMGPTDQCGENARCACDDQGRGCGCYPTACDQPGPVGDM